MTRGTIGFGVDGVCPVCGTAVWGDYPALTAGYGTERLLTLRCGYCRAQSPAVRMEEGSVVDLAAKAMRLWHAKLSAE